jgi:hypothetical protein
MNAGGGSGSVPASFEPSDNVTAPLSFGSVSAASKEVTNLTNIVVVEIAFCSKIPPFYDFFAFGYQYGIKMNLS